MTRTGSIDENLRSRLGLGTEGSGGVWGLGFRFRVQGLGVGVDRLGFRVLGLNHVSTMVSG